MRKGTILGSIVCWMLVVGVCDAEEVLNIDASGGTAGPHWVVFASKRVEEGGKKGDALVGMGQGEYFVKGYGFYYAGVRSKVTAIDEERLAALRSAEGDPATVTTIVKVSPEQYAAALAVIEKHFGEGVEQKDIPSTALFYNANVEFIGKLGLKKTYFSRNTTACSYFEDLALLNANLKVAE